MVTCDASSTPHPQSATCEHPAPTDHDGTHEGCGDCDRIKSRRAVILTRALHNPDGLTPYEFTKGMLKDDALQFWVDAKALGMVGVGQNKRGTRLLALPSYKAPA